MPVVEAPLEGGDRADVMVSSDKHSIAFEISVTTDSMQELNNIEKYGLNEADEIAVVWGNVRHLSTLRQRALGSGLID